MLTLSALLEYHCTKATDVATRIFENGLNPFAGQIEFVDRYLGFLISINDENSTLLIPTTRPRCAP